jgi:cytochrome c oxidase cbb3-type subunit 3
MMRFKLFAAAAGLFLLTTIGVRAAAQAPAQPPAAPAAPAGQRGAGQGGAGQGGRGRGAGPATFPAQQRAPGDPVLIQRGQTLYGVNCRICHGADLRGGDMGGVNLLRSALVLNDQHGELILPVVHNGRANPGMPPMPPFPGIPDDDVKALAEYIHSVAATMRGQGNPPPGSEPVALNVLVGDAQAGQRYFAAKCSSCHSPTGDLKGIGSRVSDPMALQGAWVGGSAGRGRGAGAAAAPGPNRRDPTVAVTLPSGQRIEGRLERIDDFLVVLRQADGQTRSFRRDGDVPKVEITDPLAAHKQLLTVYTDKDIHDVTAYLVTLK